MSNRTEAARRKLTESHRETTATAPVLDSTFPDLPGMLITTGFACHSVHIKIFWTRPEKNS